MEQFAIKAFSALGYIISLYCAIKENWMCAIYFVMLGAGLSITLALFSARTSNFLNCTFLNGKLVDDGNTGHGGDAESQK